ncbi:general substrate transporter [Rhizopus microsporus var. microsporus]|uniref:General substrate transporter n=2 Tax=Rhizopus microsporus TaxID=58291 RepID=A0A2G4SVU0_RHIZD|nr:general substrate transporter [Rhizopus microsporus ATCC 52813]ORE05188.1 general substrate transporter [Rhizopus microsporus var. microsporus]PHZ12865.1 general substrate transporter [Rhizopus microsporus ATCC 52813]
MDSRNASLRPFVVFCAMIASLGAFNSGFNTSSLNIPGGAVRNCPGVAPGVVTYYPNSPLPQCLPMSDWIWGVATGMFAVGGLIGAMANSYMAKRFGRRDSMLIMNTSFFIGAILLSTATTSAQFAIGRIFVGIASGFMTCVVGIYVSEISPPKYRGALTAILQLFTTLGILLIEIITLGLNSAVGWRIAVMITVAPAIIQMVLLPFCARSPRWLIGENRIDEARVEFLRLRNGDIEAEFTDMLLGLTKKGEEIKPAPESDKDSAAGFDDSVAKDAAFESEAQLNILQIASIPVLALLAIKIFVVHALSQLTGINAIMYYSTTIFEASFGDNAKYVTIGVGALNVAITFVGLALIDRLGRKTLLLISTAGMCIWQVVMTIGMKYNVAPLQVVCIMLYVAFFAIGFGMVPFVILAESFPTYAVGAASGACLAINWLCNFIIGLIFPTLLSACGPYAFLIFAGLSLVAFVFIFIFIIETKQKTIDELGRQYGWYGINIQEALKKTPKA